MRRIWILVHPPAPWYSDSRTGNSLPVFRRKASCTCSTENRSAAPIIKRHFSFRNVTPTTKCCCTAEEFGAAWQRGKISEGQRWLFVPIWGPPTKPLPKFKTIYGMQESGSIMAFQLGVETRSHR